MKTLGFSVAMVLWGGLAGAVECLPGDGDLDGDVDLADLGNMQICFSGPGGGLPPECEQFDFDADVDVDLDDVGDFLASMTDPIAAFDYGDSPRDDFEAEQLSLENFPFLLATDQHYERIQSDLAAIRAFQPNAQNVIHDMTWVPTSMIVKVTDDVERCAFDALNAFYALTDLQFLFQSGGGTWYVAHYPGRMRIPMLASQYVALPEVQFAEPDSLIGNDDSIEISTNGATWTYDMDDGFLDCFDGCDCHIFWTFEVDGQGGVTETGMECTGMPWCEFPSFCDG